MNEEECQPHTSTLPKNKQHNNRTRRGSRRPTTTSGPYVPGDTNSNTPGGLHHYEITHLHYANHTTLVYAHTVSVITRTSFPYFYKRVHSYSAPATRQHILNALVRNPRDRAGGPEHRDARAKAPPEAAKATLCGHGA